MDTKHGPKPVGLLLSVFVLIVEETRQHVAADRRVQMTSAGTAGKS